MKKKEIKLINGKLKYFNKGDFIGGQFYKLPKILFDAQGDYAKLSVNAKVVYMLFLDRVSLSMKNNKVDEENRIQIIYTQEDLAEKLNCSVKTISKVFNELKNFYGANDGLATFISQGKGYPYIIYVRMINTVKTNVVENLGDVENSGNTEKSMENNSATTSKNVAPRVEDFSVQDTSKVPASNTNINNTKDINTHSVNHSREFTSENGVLKTYQESARVTEKINPIEIIHEIYKRKELPYEYIFNPRKMEIAIKHLLDYDTMIENIGRNPKEDYTESEFKTFANTLITMLTDGIGLKNRTISNVKTYYSLIEYIKFSGTENVVKYAYIDQIDFVAISNFRKGSNLNTIRNLTNYMAVCIQDALNTGDLRIMNEINQL